jgi:hypothetical protein
MRRKFDELHTVTVKFFCIKLLEQNVTEAKPKAKAVPLHAMKGRVGIAATNSRPWRWMGVRSQRHVPAAL